MDFITTIYAMSAIIAFFAIAAAYAMAKKPSIDVMVCAIAIFLPLVNTLFILAVAFKMFPLTAVASCMEQMTAEEEDNFVSLPIKKV